MPTQPRHFPAINRSTKVGLGIKGFFFQGRSSSEHRLTPAEQPINMRRDLGINILREVVVVYAVRGGMRWSIVHITKMTIMIETIVVAREKQTTEVDGFVVDHRSRDIADATSRPMQLTDIQTQSPFNNTTTVEHKMPEFLLKSTPIS